MKQKPYLIIYAMAVAIFIIGFLLDAYLPIMHNPTNPFASTFFLISALLVGYALGIRQGIKYANK